MTSDIKKITHALPDGTVKALMVTVLHEETEDALETLSTVQVARLAASLAGTADATLAKATIMNVQRDCIIVDRKNDRERRK